jgi:CheY-like chemotaxis protein
VKVDRMRILLIEDDEHKRVSIESALADCGAGVVIQLADSLYTAIQALDGGAYDLIVLDMAIPSHPPMPGQGSPVSFLTGGLDILLELDSRGRADPCVIVTQFPEIEISQVFYSVANAVSAIKDLLGYAVLDCIVYSGEDGVWLMKFQEMLKNHGYINS